MTAVQRNSSFLKYWNTFIRNQRIFICILSFSQLRQPLQKDIKRKGFNNEASVPCCASETPPFCPHRLARSKLESRPLIVKPLTSTGFRSPLDFWIFRPIQLNIELQFCNFYKRWIISPQCIQIYSYSTTCIERWVNFTVHALEFILPESFVQMFHSSSSAFLSNLIIYLTRLQIEMPKNRYCFAPKLLNFWRCTWP